MPVCLSMIVKNEAPVIRRCLDAVRPHIDHWVICDTGSDDGTQEIIREAMAELPGELLEHEWVDFGHNRTRALEEARRVAGGDGYLLVIDADDLLVASEGFEWPEMDLDAYHLLHEMGELRWWRAQLFRADQPWVYRGVLHEYPELTSGPSRCGRVGGVSVSCGQDGARRRDKFKYLRDAEVLRKAVEKDPDDLRSLFYLAQSYRDAGQPEMAIDVYAQRWDKRRGPGDEEAWYAKYQIGRLKRRHADSSEGAAELVAAYRFRPERMEPLIELALHHRLQNDYGMCRLYAHLAAITPAPAEGLFVEPSCYAQGWRALEEYALAELFLGRTDLARRVFESALRCPGLPEGDRLRLERNLECAGGSLPPTQQVPPTIQLAQQVFKQQLAPIRNAYVENYVEDSMAMSLGSAALVAAACNERKPALVLDLGNGFCTVALRYLLPEQHVLSVDADDASLDKTRDALAEHDLVMDGLHLWSEFKGGASFPFVIHKLGDIDERVETVDAAWSAVADDGLIFFDDMHLAPIRAAVRRLLAEHPHEVFATTDLTRDDFGRYGLLVQKKGCASAAENATMPA